jgi:hypothetical protein
MKLSRSGKIILEGEASEKGHLRGNFVGSDGNDAATAERDEGKSDGIVAREYKEIIGDGVEDSGHLSDVSRGFLDADDVFEAGEVLYGGGFDVDASAPLNAIENNGKRNGG